MVRSGHEAAAQQQAEPLPGPRRIIAAVGRAGVGRSAGGDRHVVQAGGPGDLGGHAAFVNPRFKRSRPKGRRWRVGAIQAIRHFSP